jgi:hypothetical protein
MRLDRLPFASVMAILDSSETPFYLAAFYGVSLETIRTIRPGYRYEEPSCLA